MIVALKGALANINAELVEKVDLWENDEIIYKMKSDYGGFELSSNNYGCVFILAPNNQEAIKKNGLLLVSSRLFEEVAVDHAQ